MKKRSLLFILFTVLLIQLLSACTESAEHNIIPTESPVQNSEPVSTSQTETTGDNNENKATSNQNELDFDFNEAIQNIYLFGQKITLPCTIKDFGDDFSLNGDIVVPVKEKNTVVVPIQYKNKTIGVVTLLVDIEETDISKEQIVRLTLGDGYSNPINDNNWYNEVIDIDCFGINFTSTKEEIISKFGTPTPMESAYFASYLVYDSEKDGSIWIRVLNDKVVEIVINRVEMEY